MHAFPSNYLLKMPARVLFGKARAIEAWCAENDKVRPSLLDVALARQARAKEARR